MNLFNILLSDLIIEISYKLPINELSKLVIFLDDNISETIWENWVLYNIEPRHSYEVISSSEYPLEMISTDVISNKWERYAKSRANPIGNTVYLNGVFKVVKLC